MYIPALRFFFVGFILFLFSCSNKIQQENRIVVTIEVQRYFAERLAHPFFEVETMVAPGTSPESYDPTPQQMVRLAKSSAYFGIGPLGFERAWLDKLKQNNPKVRFFDNSKGISFIASESHHHGADESGIDPHIWTSPRNVLIIVQNMYEALTAIDPQNESVYRENLKDLRNEIIQTGEMVQALLNRSSQKAFVVYHPALAYFAQDYGLKQYPIEVDGKEPSPEQLKELVDLVKREKVKTVFIQQEFDRKNAEIIARETNCKLVVINPLSYNWKEEIIRIAEKLPDE
ncbi:MAG: zinc ABC transporter substrate-binding protein [Dysgonamonadaceae bacterium]|jgi:zinc transport system substrate-binding protein|nr:zinc ABC transporter substrate-binding protein [Dysgonamonadaceae bacterium]